MLLDDLGDYLETQSLGVVNTDIFLGNQPDKPDNCVTLFEYSGDPPDHSRDSRIDRPGLQVIARNTSYVDGRQKLQQIQNLIDGLNGVTINGTRYISIFANQSPMPLGKDESGRMEWSQNYSVRVDAL